MPPRADPLDRERRAARPFPAPRRAYNRSLYGQYSCQARKRDNRHVCHNDGKGTHEAEPSSAHLARNERRNVGKSQKHLGYTRKKERFFPCIEEGGVIMELSKLEKHQDHIK